ncbi:hypothetical protein [Polyangium sp. y55x31]|uniref:hypothetical protein n=1 Tax=Polyangium sp. y55x31 TaxID=3042688 RepID=UPI0024827D39|nr:hypothetical protein [Polyangium sp. y55x31]MDI1478239.1 hypothetical protein [Polyangium sp. y55x31]
MHFCRGLLLASTWVILLAGCGGSGTRSNYPPGQPIALLEGTAHLGDNRAGSQNFPSGLATAARLCSLVNVPEALDAFLQVVNLRNSETLSNLITVNGKPFPLGITLERDPYGNTPLSTQTSPVFAVHLEPGPSEVCLVTGKKANGDVDDIEVDQVLLFVEGIDPEDVSVRRGLGLGTPPPSQPPSRPWGSIQ